MKFDIDNWFRCNLWHNIVLDDLFKNSTSVQQNLVLDNCKLLLNLFIGKILLFFNRNIILFEQCIIQNINQIQISIFI